MSGTITGLAGACQINSNGKPLKGGLAYIFTGGTTTPTITYQDIGLALTYTNPLEFDDNGRCPFFYLADGIYRVRVTDVDGVIQYDQLQVPSIGASTSGGSGSAVDATTVFGTGDVKWQPIDGVVTGWVRVNGRTIGSAASGASERANADCSALYAWLWANFSDTKCPVSGGRGASAAADFAANKTITLLDFRDRALVGLDSMGNAAAGGLLAANITSGGGDTVNTAAATGGEANHTLTVGESAAHDHGGVTGNESPDGETTAASNLNDVPSTERRVRSSVNQGTVHHTHTIASQGGGNAHNTMGPFVLGSWYQKL